MADTETLDLLRSIDASLKALLGRGTVAPSSEPTIASDRDLDGPYGDPEVKARDPRDWTGPTMKGKRFSECPPEYLDMVAERLDYFSTQITGTSEEDQKKLRFNKLDAARARGWAKRLRAGWKRPAVAPAWPDDQI